MANVKAKAAIPAKKLPVNEKAKAAIPAIPVNEKAKAAIPAKKLPVISADVEDGVLKLTFGTGEVLTVDPLNLSEAIMQQAVLHGLKQKLVDAAAIARDQDTGLSATPAEKIAAVREVYDRITAPDGTWNKVREAGAGTGSGSGLLRRALMQMTGKTGEVIDTFLEGKSKDEKAALRSDPRVAATIAELQRAKMGDIDTESYLKELEG
jgi:hypothetical protein